MKKIFWILFILVVLIGGGYYLWNLAQEAARQELLQKQKIERELQLKKEQEERERIRQEQVRKQNIVEYKEVIASTKAELQMAYERLNTISEFQFMRTPEEKEAQLKQQYKHIDQLKERLNKFEVELSKINY